MPLADVLFVGETKKGGCHHCYQASLNIHIRFLSVVNYFPGDKAFVSDIVQDALVCGQASGSLWLDECKARSTTTSHILQEYHKGCENASGEIEKVQDLLGCNGCMSRGNVCTCDNR